ncbi:MAG: carbamoyl phosphate synthase small subunit, partial [Candidatus Omnitrophota bacterium]|nr:carbamoyl phosphate synthase small subunit [Candidatus Omnitrophota bacterium]
MQAFLALEDGKIFKGESFGANGERSGEVVFNTSMAGYQEIITDPSYKGQIVTMTYPLIGNYGINKDDAESRQPFLEGFVVKEYSKIASNWRSDQPLGVYLKENRILGIEGIDTRKLTLHIREKGAMKAVLSTEDFDENSLIKKAKASRGLIGVDLVKEVTIPKRYNYKLENNGLASDSQSHAPAKNCRYKVVVLDCGVKYNMLRELSRHKCNVIVMPAQAPAQEILEAKPDGVLLSNGPGDPAALDYVVKTV